MNQQSPPPIPDSGLPPGWSQEQWNAYGHAWNKQLELQAQTEPAPVQPQFEANVQPQTGFQQPMPILLTPQHNSASKTFSTVVIVTIAVVVIFIFTGVLYVLENSLTPKEIEGTWYNPVDTITFNSDGSVVETTGHLEEWRVEGNRLYLVSSDLEDGYEYYFHYEISENSNVLWLAPYDETDTDTIASESCIAYTRGSGSTQMDDFEEQINAVEIPSWCDPGE